MALTPSQFELTDVERALIEHVGDGTVLDLSDGDGEPDRAAMITWGPSRTVRAVVIRDILRGRHVADPDPHGLQIRGARIQGRLDLQYLTTTMPVWLSACYLPEGVNADHAHLSLLGLERSRIEASSGSPLAAEALRTERLYLTGVAVECGSWQPAVHLGRAHLGMIGAAGATLTSALGPALLADGIVVDDDVLLRSGFAATGSGEAGAVRLIGAHIGGQLDVSAGALNNDAGPALVADGLAVDDDVFLRGGFAAAGNGERGAVRLPGAHIGGSLDASGATLTCHAGPALNADGVVVNGGMLLRDGFTATGSGELGAVHMFDAHIGHQLDACGATLNSDAGPALTADRLVVDAGLYLRAGFVATASSERAAVRLLGAHIRGQLVASGATLTNDAGPALDADGVTVDAGIFLQEGFTAAGSGELGAVRLLSAHIGGSLDASGANLRCDAGPALNADGLAAAADLLLSELTATASGELGAVRLSSAHVGGVLVASGATLTCDAGPALRADGLIVDDDVYLRGSTATGSGEWGAVRLVGAHIGGQLDASGATLHCDAGPALDAEALMVDAAVFLRKGFTATGSGEIGAVRLLDARIGGQLDASDATLVNRAGPALRADRLAVDRVLYLDAGFTACGEGDLGAVRLVGARIGGRVTAAGASLNNPAGPALCAESMRVEGDLLLDEGFAALGASRDGAVTLRGVEVVGSIALDAGAITDPSQAPGVVNLDGLAYRGLPRQPSVDGWLDLLRDRSPRYAAQPYQHLAAAARAAGHDGQSRQILIAQRKDQLRRAETTRRERLWGAVTGATLGYGYQPWRALLLLLVLVVVSVALTVGAGGRGGLAYAAASDERPCTTLQTIAAGLELSVPILDTEVDTGCATTNTPAGQALAVAGWVLQLAAWSLATLFIAGFTSAVRKT